MDAIWDENPAPQRTFQEVRRSRRAGNLLLSALFMAAFLFFLSVALVLTNREDIQYTLFTDHKMRCNLAADGTLDYALQVMRTNSNWEEKFKTWRVPFQSGAEGQVSYRPWTEPSVLPGATRFSLPLTPSPSAGIELIATGKSGLFASERHMLLEEFRLADSMLKGDIKPHLVNVSEAGAAMILTPTFTWEKAPATTSKPIMGSLSASAGPVFHLSEDQGSPPPEVKDFALQTVAGIPMPIPGFPLSSSQIPKGHGAFFLQLKDNNLGWVRAPDPGDQLGGDLTVQAQITPDDGGTAASGWDKITLNWDTLAKTPSELTVDYSYFNGPRINWYSLVGTRAQVLDDEYICHARHYFYSGFRFKNSQAGGGVTHTQYKRPDLFDEPCILSFNLKTQKWKVVLDYLKVDPDPLVEPTIINGLHPDSNSLLVLAGPQVYTHVEGQADNSWYSVGKEQLTLANLPKRASLFSLGNEILYCDPRGDTDVAPPLMALNQHDIAPFFPKFLPVLNEGGTYDAKQNLPGEFEPQLNLRWSIDQASLTGYAQDLYGVARLAVTFTPPAQAPQTVQASGLAHWDGKRWQILPAGLSRLLPDPTSYKSEMSRDYAGGDGPLTGKFVLAGYASEKSLLRRYVPVARWGPN
jgi:hypothetical protein